MSRWQTERLDQVAYIEMGQSPPGHTYNSRGEGVPFFQGKAQFGEIFPTADKWCTEPRKIAEPKDILLSVRAPVGPTNRAAERSCIGRGLAAIRAKSGLADQISFIGSFVAQNRSWRQKEAAARFRRLGAKK